MANNTLPISVYAQLLHDKLKRKALLVLGPIGQDGLHNVNGGPHGHLNEDHSANHRGFGANIGNNVNLGAVVGGVEANAVGSYHNSSLFPGLYGIGLDPEDANWESDNQWPVLTAGWMATATTTGSTAINSDPYKKPFASTTLCCSNRPLLSIRTHK